ncbi:Bug family tripartite tricarboxylate transporter substrate binding protein [Cupriavidus sp. PET2-C1]
MKKLPLPCAAIASALFGAALPAFANTSDIYPDKPIRLVVPQSPGSVADIMARVLSKPLSDRLGQSIVVENRAGGSGIIAAKLVANAAPDGYTLLVGSVSTHGLISSIDKSHAYDAIKDFEPVSQINDAPLVLVVSPSSGLTSLKELAQRARAKPGSLTYATGGNASGSRFAVELLRLNGKLDMVHIPYRSPAEAVRAVVAGEATLGSPAIPSAPELIRAGRLRALAVTGESRSPLLPDVPTAAESGFPSVVFYNWTGIFAPANTPARIVAKLNEAVRLSLQNPDVIKAITESGARPVGQSPEQFKAFVKTEVSKWARTAHDANITND